MTSPSMESVPAGPNTSTSSPNWLTVAQDAIWRFDCQQIPEELATLLALLDGTVRPVTVLEIGGWNGGSAYAWSQLPSVRQVITVTLPDSPLKVPELANGVIWHKVLADSQLDDTAAQVRQLVGGGRAGLVWIDGDHTAPAAMRDWQLYGPIAAPGGLVAFHDINDVPQHPEIDVWPVWQHVRTLRRSMALVQAPGQLGGTGIIWA